MIDWLFAGVPNEIARFIILIVLWSILGFLIPMCTSLGEDGFCYVNPIYIYNRWKVNWFGCFILTLIFSLICPLGTIGYWLYFLCKLFVKLCTVGRR